MLFHASPKIRLLLVIGTLAVSCPCQAPAIGASTNTADAYVTVQDGKLMLNGERARFWGAIGNFPFPSTKENEAVVDRLDALGFNMVRYWEEASSSTYTKGDNSRGDQIDYFLYLLKQKGFKVWMAALNGGTATADDSGISKDYFTEKAWQDGMTAWVQQNGNQPVSLSGNLACIWDARLEALKLKHMRQVANHVNAYTGERYADDSVFGIWELSNEEWWFGKMVGGAWQNYPPFFRESLISQWNGFLKKKYTNNAGLVTAWGFLLPGENLADKTIQLAPLRDPSKPVVLNDASPVARQALAAVNSGLTRDQFTEARGRDVIEFLLQIWLAHKQRLNDAVKTMGKSIAAAPLVWDTGIGYEIQAQYLQEHAGAVAHDTYITGFSTDPTDEHYPWISGLTQLPRLCGDVPWVEQNRVEGKPYFVYETQIEQPAKYRAEYPLRVAALGAIQDWDAVNWHYFGQSVDLSSEEPYSRAMDYSPSGQGHPQGYHYQFDEVQQAVMRVAAEIFKNGLLKSAPTPTVYTFGMKALTDPASMDYGTSYGDVGRTFIPTTYRYGVRLKIDPNQQEYSKIDGPTVQQGLNESCPINPTDEIEYNWERGYLKFDAPGTTAYVGFYANYGKPLTFADGISVENVTFNNPEGTPYPVKADEQYMAFALASTDKAPLDKTKRAVLSLVSTSFNSKFQLDTSKLVGGLQWTQNPGSIGSTGELPILITRVGATIKGAAITGMNYRFINFNMKEIGSGKVSDAGLAIPDDKPVFEVELSR